MKYRKLRIAWSVVCAIACLLLVALWVRSYRYDTAASIHGERVEHVSSHKRLLTAWSKLGAVHLCAARPPVAGAQWKSHFATSQVMGFGVFNDVESSALRIPYWFAIVATCAITIFPWTQFFSVRFTLRTLLIATSLVAAMLGLIAYYARY